MQDPTGQRHPAGDAGAPLLRAAVLGWPARHSLSPLLHGYWLETYGINGRYEAMDVAPPDFAATLARLQAEGYRGVNITLPHKEAALAWVDRADEAARRAGAVNTIIFGDAGSGGSLGSNTDGYGFLENLRSAGWSRARRALVLGAGGAARGIVVALLEAGTEEVVLINRTRARAEALKEDLGHVDATLARRIAIRDWAAREAALEDISLLVNATSLGMTGMAPLDLRLDRLAPGAAVADIVYVPLETPLLAEARRRGHPVADGLGMLIHQARPGFEAWFGHPATPTPAQRGILEAALRQREGTGGQPGTGAT